MVYISTDFGVDSSSRFPFRAQTNRQTRLNALPHDGGYTAGVSKYARVLFRVIIRLGMRLAQ